MTANTRLSVGSHLLVGLAFVGSRGATSEELAASVTTHPVLVRRILSRLARAKLVVAETGRSGGYRLGRPPSKITLLDVYLAVEPEGSLALHENPVNKACAVSCEIKGLLGPAFAKAEKALQGALRATTIASLLDGVRR